MKFNVTEIEFDFDDECYGYDPLTFDEEISIRDQALGVCGMLTMKMTY